MKRPLCILILLAAVIVALPVLAQSSNALQNLKLVSDSELKATSQAVVSAVEYQRLEERYATLVEDNNRLASDRQRLEDKLADEQKRAESTEEQLRTVSAEKAELAEQLARLRAEHASLSAKLVPQDSPRQGTETGQSATLEPQSTAAVADRSAIAKLLTGWAAAWSAQDVEAYLAHYAADFRPSGGKRRADWEKLRRARLTKPEFIQVSLQKVAIVPLGPESVQVTFVQSYTSNSYADKVTKRLELNKQGGDWKIWREKSLQ